MNKVTRMKVKRITLGWSQKELAQISHVPSNIVSQIETCRLIPYPTYARRLSDALGIPAHELQQEITPANVDTII